MKVYSIVSSVDWFNWLYKGSQLRGWSIFCWPTAIVEPVTLPLHCITLLFALYRLLAVINRLFYTSIPFHGQLLNTSNIEKGWLLVEYNILDFTHNRLRPSIHEQNTTSLSSGLPDKTEHPGIISTSNSKWPPILPFKMFVQQVSYFGELSSIWLKLNSVRRQKEACCGTRDFFPTSLSLWQWPIKLLECVHLTFS